MPIMSHHFLKFGGKRAALAYYLYRMRHLCGTYQRYMAVDWKRVERFVVVCSGNICRSPYAYERFKLLNFHAASSGTTAIEGAPADVSARRIAAERGVNLATHFSAPFAARAYAPTDLLIALEPHHLISMLPAASLAGAQLTLMGLWCKTPSPYIPDPFGKPDCCFRFVFSLVDEAIERIAGLARQGVPLH